MGNHDFAVLYGSTTAARRRDRRLLDCAVRRQTRRTNARLAPEFMGSCVQRRGKTPETGHAILLCTARPAPSARYIFGDVVSALPISDDDPGPRAETLCRGRAHPRASVFTDEPDFCTLQRTDRRRLPVSTKAIINVGASANRATACACYAIMHPDRMEFVESPTTSTRPPRRSRRRGTVELAGRTHCTRQVRAQAGDPDPRSALKPAGGRTGISP